MWIFTGFVFYWLQATCQFVSQPGDVELTAIPGYQLHGYIPCILEAIPYVQVGWEQKTETNETKTISSNRTLHHLYNGSYMFKDGGPLDYSIQVKEVQPTWVQMRCFVMHPSFQFNYSSWSNITLTGTVRLIQVFNSCIFARFFIGTNYTGCFYLRP